MISHLASLSERRLVLSFAPKTPYYSVLKRIGELFPGPSKVGGRLGVCMGARVRRVQRGWSPQPPAPLSS